MNTKITRTVTVTIEPTPLELAVAFTEMDAEAQAAFFVEVARIMATWDGPAAGPMQIHYVAKSMLERGDSGSDACHMLADLGSCVEAEARRRLSI